jgi:hypothetical protein
MTAHGLDRSTNTLASLLRVIAPPLFNRTTSWYPTGFSNSRHSLDSRYPVSSTEGHLR